MSSFTYALKKAELSSPTFPSLKAESNYGIAGKRQQPVNVRRVFSIALASHMLISARHTSNIYTCTQPHSRLAPNAMCMYYACGARQLNRYVQHLNIHSAYIKLYCAPRDA